MGDFQVHLAYSRLPSRALIFCILPATLATIYWMRRLPEDPDRSTLVSNLFLGLWAATIALRAMLVDDDSLKDLGYFDFASLVAPRSRSSESIVVACTQQIDVVEVNIRSNLLWCFQGIQPRCFGIRLIPSNIIRREPTNKSCMGGKKRGSRFFVAFESLCTSPCFGFRRDLFRCLVQSLLVWPCGSLSGRAAGAQWMLT